MNESKDGTISFPPKRQYGLQPLETPSSRNSVEWDALLSSGLALVRWHPKYLPYATNCNDVEEGGGMTASSLNSLGKLLISRVV